MGDRMEKEMLTQLGDFIIEDAKTCIDFAHSKENRGLK